MRVPLAPETGCTAESLRTMPFAVLEQGTNQTEEAEGEKMNQENWDKLIHVKLVLSQIAAGELTPDEREDVRVAQEALEYCGAKA